MSYILCLPFIGLILSMALLPTLKPRFWHRYDKAICLWWAAFVIVMILYFNGQSFVFSKVSHALFHHYIPFISIVSSLYLIGAGIRVELAGTPSPLKNSFFLMIGGLLSNIIGTTGASMLLIRPFLGFNRHRRQQTHLVIFFIFTVANIGGVLLPLGDPPLFLGFLEGVPFFWTLQHMWPSFICVFLGTILFFYVVDRHFFSKEEGYRIDQEDKARFKLRGKRNLFILAAVIGVILIYGQVCHLRFDMSILGEHVEGMALLRDIAILSLGFLSVFVTPKTIHHKNLFSYAPLTEILAVFFAIFVTLIPLIDAMKQGKSGIFSPILSLMDTSNDHASLLYFWISGLLSAFLDNAPTYLVFFNLAGGDAELLTTQLKPILIGLSAGTVFMGAMSYIGNAPNFMVRSLAVHRGIPMPSFFGFLGWSCCILIPIFVLYSVFIKFFLHY